jgi:hypothetical protein
MKFIWNDRRTFVATLAILCLTAMCLLKGVDTSIAITTAAGVVAACNAWEKRGTPTAGTSGPPNGIVGD